MTEGGSASERERASAFAIEREREGNLWVINVEYDARKGLQSVFAGVGVCVCVCLCVCVCVFLCLCEFACRGM